jgi:chromate transporter
MGLDPATSKAPSLSAVFRVFLVIGLTAFGGGASAHIHDAVVRRERWLDERRMLEGMTFARIIPGTNVSNLAAFVGSALAGIRGAAVAVCGVVLPGVFIVFALAVGYTAFAQHGERIQTGLHGLTAGAVGIMASLVVNAARPVAGSARRVLFALAAFVGVGVLHANMLLVLAVLLPLASWAVAGERAS